MTRSPTAPARPALRYHGGKWRMAKWIIGHMPAHKCYCEPFGGAASVLLQKAPAYIEVYNDKGRRVVQFFKVLRERPEAFIRAIELTPYSRAEFQQAHERCDDELEAARRFYILSRQGRGGPTARWNTGWRFQRAQNRGARVVEDFTDVDHLWDIAARLRMVQIECDDALPTIRRFDDPETLFYVDPPYVWSTRSKWATSNNGYAYEHELDDDGHRELAALLHTIRGMAIVSGAPGPLYDELYAGWRRVAIQERDDRNMPRTECLWLNPAAAARAPQRTIDDYLDGGVDDDG